MSERYGHSKGKSYNKRQIEGSQENIRTKAYEENDMEPRTPPLPSRRSSIDELLKKRESLKQELKKIVKHSDSDIPRKHSTKYDKHRHSKSNNESYSRKRSSSEKQPSNLSKKKVPIDYSPERTGDYEQMESEDEEMLIEKSRQRRKELLETLTVSQGIQVQEEESMKKISNTKKDFKKSDSDHSKSINKLTDMFSETDDNFVAMYPDKVTQDDTEESSQLTDNWDDADGYYNIIIGDQIDKKRYTIKSILGQGVFSNVVRAQDTENGNADVAIKIIRNNEITLKNGLREIFILRELREEDPENKHHCVRMFRHFMHRNHLCMVLESLHMDLRHVVKKYGHHHGINMKAIISYSRQLLIALRQLKKLGIVHADIKPDNILVNEKKNVLKLCDFGSAAKVPDIETTPYLVSRFYRAPEIILGIPYKHSIDIWSTACTMYEMATGRIMFPGSSNNKMLKCFMDLKGKCSSRVIRKGKFKDQHFNYKNNFLLHKKDEHTGREKYVEMSHIPITRDLLLDLKKHCKSSTENEEKKIAQLKDLLEKMLVLDASHRYGVTDCLKHPFIREEHTK